MMRMLTVFGLIGAIWTVMSASGNAASVTIVRGDQVEKVSTARKSRLPHVLRGKPAADQPEAPRETRASGLQVIQAGGSTLWLHNADTGRIIACTVWSSGIVGRDKLRCTGRNF